MAALETLLKRYEKMTLVPEAMLTLADIKTKAGQLVEANSILDDIRSHFPQTLESVKALDRLADNQAKAGDKASAKKLRQQVIEEADALAGGKYVWYVNVQACSKRSPTPPAPRAKGSDRRTCN